MFLLDLAYGLEQECDACETFFAGVLSETCVHVCPLVVFAVCGIEQVCLCVRYLAVMEKLEPKLCMLTLVACCLLEYSGDLLIAFLLCCGSIVCVLVSCLRLACECCHQILFCLCSFKFHFLSPY